MGYPWTLGQTTIDQTWQDRLESASDYSHGHNPPSKGRRRISGLFQQFDITSSADSDQDQCYWAFCEPTMIGLWRHLLDVEPEMGCILWASGSHRLVFLV